MNTVTTKSNVMVQNGLYKYYNLSSKKLVNLAGSLRKSVGLKILKKIQNSRKSDW